MANWRAVDESDLAATLSQGEIDGYRRDAGIDGSDPVALLLSRTAALVRNWISCNGSVRMGPAGTIPEGLVSPAMDYAAADVLKRLNAPMNEDRRRARERAEELFEKIANGTFTPESADGDENRPAGAPAFAEPHPERLLD